MNLTPEEMGRLVEGRDLQDELAILLNEKQPHEVMMHFMEGHEWIDGEEYEVRSVERDGDTIYATCTISYYEGQTSGCPEIPLRTPGFAYFRFTVEPGGDVEFEFDY